MSTGESRENHADQAAALVIVEVDGNSKQAERVLELEALARNAGDRHSRVVVIDATKKKSASKTWSCANRSRNAGVVIGASAMVINRS